MRPPPRIQARRHTHPHPMRNATAQALKEDVAEMKKREAQNEKLM